MPRFFHARIARMIRCRQVDDTILIRTNCTNDTMSTSRRHDLFIARIARIARYRQVDNTIFVAREGNISCLPLAEIVFIRVFCAESIVPSACGNRVHSCLSCKKESCKKYYRAFRLRKSCHSCRSCRKNRARKHRVFRLRKSCSFVSFMQGRIVQEVLSCIPLAEIVFIRVFRARKNRARSIIVSSACGNRVIRVFHAESIVPSACGNRVHSCLLCKRIVQEVSCLPLAEIVFIRAFRARETCKIQRIHLTQKHGDTEAHFFWH